MLLLSRLLPPAVLMTRHDACSYDCAGYDDVDDDDIENTSTRTA